MKEPESIVAYRAEDGTLCETSEAARKRNLTQWAERMLGPLFRSHPAWPDATAALVFNNPAELARWLQRNENVVGNVIATIRESRQW